MYNQLWYGTKYNMLDPDSVYYSRISMQSYIDNIKQYAIMVVDEMVLGNFTKDRMELHPLGEKVRMEYYRFYGQFKQI